MGASARTYDDLALPVRRHVLFAGEHTCKVICTGYQCPHTFALQNSGHIFSAAGSTSCTYLEAPASPGVVMRCAGDQGTDSTIASEQSSSTERAEEERSVLSDTQY